MSDNINRHQVNATIDNIIRCQVDAIIRQNPYTSKTHDLEHIRIHKTIFAPYGFNNWLNRNNRQRDIFMKLGINEYVLVRQGRYGSNTRDNNRYLLVKIITSEPEISIIPNMYVVLNSDFCNDENIIENYDNYVEYVGILTDRQKLEYLENDFTIQPFKALNHKIEIISEGTDSINYLLPYNRGSIHIL